MYALGAAPVTLAERAQTASVEFLLDRALTTALALPAFGAEVAANEWVGADELGLDGDDSVWAGTVLSRTSEVQLDGWIGGLAVAPKAGRDLLLERGGGLEWFRSPRKLSTRVSIAAAPVPRGLFGGRHVDPLRGAQPPDSLSARVCAHTRSLSRELSRTPESGAARANKKPA